MQDGFVKVAACTPRIRVADVEHNAQACAKAIVDAAHDGAKLVVLPELCITGSTCGDLFWQGALIDVARDALLSLADETADVDALVIVGAPVRVGAKLYDCAVVLCHGAVLGVVPKACVGGASRHFAPGPRQVVGVDLGDGEPVPFGTSQLFLHPCVPAFAVGVEFADDLRAPEQPSVAHALNGATIVACLGATSEQIGRAAYDRMLVTTQSARLQCGYVCASAGWGESTTDFVFSGHNMVVECGHVLAESAPFGDGVATSEIDVDLLDTQRQRDALFADKQVLGKDEYLVSEFFVEPEKTELTRTVDPHPFVPAGEAERAARCEEVFAIQAHGVARRLEHTRSKAAVIGISGGLDSTLALLVTVRAFDLLGLDRAGIIAVTMPGFGTTSRTKGNATTLADALGVQLREVSIAASVRQHFADIGHDESVHDVTYENAQARERTQIIMDIANQEGGLVVGTGDLSELALGWATYNGDHMSMYCANGGVPKTLIRHLVGYVADTCGNEVEARVLRDVVDTPVSPELLPANEDGTIAQQTEDLVGPYELHDFVLHQVLRNGARPRKVYRLARQALGGTYDDATILKWLRTFYRRFFSQQFKRSCLPDGPKVGSVGVSPRGDLRMPSDALATLWLAELDELG
ncbi:MAG: NAD(+) synthase [Coriobacteriales bacterium]|nr:NAD(+) synthase [Coriobacteriales bacterium]